MNKVILMGRLTRDPDVRWTQGQDQKCVARFTLAVDRKIKRTEGNDQQTADFISMVAFGKRAEFVEKYCKKGIKLAITGRIATGSYTNRDGQKVYTTDVVADDLEFVESKKAAGDQNSESRKESQTDDDGFMNIPDEIDDELPFS